MDYRLALLGQLMGRIKEFIAKPVLDYKGRPMGVEFDLEELAVILELVEKEFSQSSLQDSKEVEGRG